MGSAERVNDGAQYALPRRRYTTSVAIVNLTPEIEMKYVRTGFAILVAAAGLWTSAAVAAPLVVKPLVERTVAQLPPGDLFWRIENFATTGEAQGAAGPWSLVAESAGKVWLFTLGAAGQFTPGGTKATELGPIARVPAPRYLLRINEASGAPGSATNVHFHAGSEAYYVLKGEQSIRGPDGVLRVEAGRTEAGRAPGVPMEVSSSGAIDLLSLVMFVVDATRPFATPTTLP